MRRLLPLALVAVGGLVGALLPTATASGAIVREKRLDGVLVRLHPRTQQVVTVNRTHGYHARVTFWRLVDGSWRQRWRTRDGRIGYGGLAAPRHRHQGSGTTPLGTTRLITSFGTHRASAAWELPYRRTHQHDYWVEDNRSRFYNRYRSKAQGGFRWWLSPGHVNGSERLRAYPRQYEFAVVTSYNYAHPVHHRGAGIFLHVNGRGATAGCVSVPRRQMAEVMAQLDPNLHPVMAVGR
jgi:L,D-peptidoglycan transpeptidase YkuD (ErfK/YbiS/YcfS/YnhG family)